MEAESDKDKEKKVKELYSWSTSVPPGLTPITPCLSFICPRTPHPRKRDATVSLLAPQNALAERKRQMQKWREEGMLGIVDLLHEMTEKL